MSEKFILLSDIYPEIFLLECSCMCECLYERFKGYIPSGRLGLQQNCRICGLELSS